MTEVHQYSPKFVSMLLFQLTCLGFASVARGGEPLHFSFIRLSADQKQCLQSGNSALVAEGLQTQSNRVRSQGASFVAGGDAKTTAIIDCSDVGSKGGRVTVMVTNSKYDNARDLSTKLLNRIIASRTSSN